MKYKITITDEDDNYISSETFETFETDYSSITVLKGDPYPNNELFIANLDLL